MWGQWHAQGRNSLLVVGAFLAAAVQARAGRPDAALQSASIAIRAVTVDAESLAHAAVKSVGAELNRRVAMIAVSSEQ